MLLEIQGNETIRKWKHYSFWSFSFQISRNQVIGKKRYLGKSFFLGRQ